MSDPQRQASGQPVSLLDYLEQQGWRAMGRSGREEVSGLCPLHQETRPSFYVNRRKQVFYCHGCGQGGDLIRLMQRLHGLSFREAWARLRPAPSAHGLLEETFRFYQAQLPRFDQARPYLARRGIQRPATIAQLRIGYTPGACLRAHLENLGYDRARSATTVSSMTTGWRPLLAISDDSHRGAR
jgi:DNA primase